WFIRASLATLSRGVERGQRARSQVPVRTGPIDSDTLLMEARLIGDRLASLAVGDHVRASWMGLTLLGERVWSLSPAGVDLYSGLPGIALFLAYLGELTGESRYTTLARSAYATAAGQLESMRDADEAKVPIGSFNGLGGIVYVCSHLAALWNDTRLLEVAMRWAGRIVEVVDTDRDLDFMSGSAGAIAAMASL